MIKISYKKKLEELSESELNDHFSDIIREKLSPNNFWKWVQLWKDPNILCIEAENWDPSIKIDELINIKKLFNIS